MPVQAAVKHLDLAGPKKTHELMLSNCHRLYVVIQLLAAC